MHAYKRASRRQLKLGGDEENWYFELASHRLSLYSVKVYKCEKIDFRLENVFQFRFSRFSFSFLYLSTVEPPFRPNWLIAAKTHFDVTRLLWKWASTCLWMNIRMNGRGNAFHRDKNRLFRHLAFDPPGSKKKKMNKEKGTFPLWRCSYIYTCVYVCMCIDRPSVHSLPRYRRSEERIHIGPINRLFPRCQRREKKERKNFSFFLFYAVWHTVIHRYATLYSPAIEGTHAFYLSPSLLCFALRRKQGWEWRWWSFSSFLFSAFNVVLISERAF